uniref:Uncharacterized protein n=1 Tax=Prymnesium polylepis TaxID=72548 RepID=A0A7S4HCD3_9EUKA
MADGQCVVDVSAGVGHSLAVCADGQVASWGLGFLGFSDASPGLASIPTLVALPESVSTCARPRPANTVLFCSATLAPSTPLETARVTASVTVRTNWSSRCRSRSRRSPARASICVIAAGGSHSLVADGVVWEFGFEATSRLDWSDDEEDEEDDDMAPKLPVHPRGEPTILEKRAKHGSE